MINFLEPERYYNVKLFLQAANYFAVSKHLPETVSDASILTKHCLEPHWHTPNRIPTGPIAVCSAPSASQTVALFAAKIPVSRLEHAATLWKAIPPKASFARPVIS